jgi:ABC-2 type transport system permease protein
MNRPGWFGTFRTAAGLGWKIESNWTDPFLFAVYSIVKPLSHAAILVVMFLVVTAGKTDTPLFTYIYIGNAFFTYVTSVIVGVSFGIIDDRERYRTLKYLAVAPIRLPVYLLGRGAAQFAMGSVAVLLTLVLGTLFFDLPLSPAAIDWPLLGVSLLLGLAGLALVGLIVAGITLLTARSVDMIGVAVAGSLYLVSGAIFPLEVLPGWLSPVGYAVPITWWLELTRRSLVGAAASASPSLAAFDDGQVLLILLAETAVLAALALFVFRIADREARERGLLDLTTNY